MNLTLIYTYFLKVVSKPIIDKKKSYFIMEGMGIPKSNIKFVKVTLTGNKGQVTKARKLNEAFGVNTGVRQGLQISYLTYPRTMRERYNKLKVTFITNHRRFELKPMT